MTIQRCSRLVAAAALAAADIPVVVGIAAQSQKLLDFTKQYNMPRDHGFHTHTYFTTYKVHLRNADRWVTLLDKGRMTSLDNAEVRALASCYGDPDQPLAEDWRPEIAGINTPGDYMKDYAPDPWTYEHFYPGAAAGKHSGVPAENK
jgi:hypothetical protein